jgi:hypothetical protein
MLSLIKKVLVNNDGSVGKNIAGGSSRIPKEPSVFYCYGWEKTKDLSVKLLPKNFRKSQSFFNSALCEAKRHPPLQPKIT